MTLNTHRTAIDLGPANLTPGQLIEIERAASQARAEHFGRLVTAGWSRIGHAIRHVSELFAFAQRMNSNARL